MGIKVKYDPVGSAAMAAYATGIGQGNERRDLQNDLQDLREDRNNLMGGRRLGGGLGGMPAGVATNPIAAKEWNQINGGIRNIEDGRTFDMNVPATVEGHTKLTERKRQIEEANPDPTPAEQALKGSYLGDAKGNPVPDNTPGATRWTPDPTGKGPPIPWAVPKPVERPDKALDEKNAAAQIADIMASEAPDKQRRAQEVIDAFNKKHGGADATPSVDYSKPIPGGTAGIQDWIDTAGKEVDVPYSDEQRIEARGHIQTYEEYQGIDASSLTDPELKQLIIDHWKRRLAAQKPAGALPAPAAPAGAPAPAAPAPATTPPGAPAGMGANPTPELTNTWVSEQGVASDIKHYEELYRKAKAGKYALNAKVRPQWEADFSRRWPDVDPKGLTDDQLILEHVDNLKSMRTSADSTPPMETRVYDLGSGTNRVVAPADPQTAEPSSPSDIIAPYGSMTLPGSAAPADPLAAERQRLQAEVAEIEAIPVPLQTLADKARLRQDKARLGQMDLQVRNSAAGTASSATGLPTAQPAKQGKNRGTAQPPAAAAPPPASSGASAQPRQRSSGSDPGTSKQLFEMAVKRKPKMKDHPIVKSALEIFAKQKSGIAFSKDDAWIIWQANEIIKNS